MESTKKYFLMLFAYLWKKITNLEKLIDDLFLMMSSTFPKFNVPKFTFRKRLTVTGIYDIWQLKVIFNRESLTKLYQRATWFYKNIFLEYTGGTRLEHDRRPNFLIIANITFFKNYSLFLIRRNCKTFMESFALRSSNQSSFICPLFWSPYFSAWTDKCFQIKLRWVSFLMIDHLRIDAESPTLYLDNAIFLPPRLKKLSKKKFWKRA